MARLARRPPVNPTALHAYLSGMVEQSLRLSVMIWGAPGIGKSSVVAQVAREHELQFIDLRISQLAPTDLRGLPVPEDGLSRWFPPEFLPRSGRGVLFLDELNMAPPAVQGIAQQLILDRRVGLYEVPPGWFLWAAGNRKEDRAAVFDMPSPLANRFIHLDVEPELESFRRYAIARELHPHILAFLAFRPELLHKLDPTRPAWPSPRSWEMASHLYRAGLDVAPAIGGGAAAELSAFLSLYEKLADLDLILSGDATHLSFPEDPSARYALTVGLGLRSTTIDQALSAFHWMIEASTAEWVQLFVSHMAERLRATGQLGALAAAMQSDEQLARFLSEYLALLQGR